jgi:hypothetical protein
MTAMNTNFFKDKHGKVVLVQPPNLPIIGWFGFSVINFFVHSPQLAWLATALLFTWAFMELYLGASHFRRLLGLIVLVEILITHLR